MKTIYIDCSMGAAGDMLTAALLELLDESEREGFIEEFNGLGLPGIVMQAEASVKCGVEGTHVHMLVNGVEEDEHLHDDHHTHGHHAHTHGEHPHTHSDGTTHTHTHNGVAEITHIVESHLNVPANVRKTS